MCQWEGDLGAWGKCMNCGECIFSFFNLEFLGVCGVKEA